MISIQDITFGYNRHKVLSNFSLQIKRGGIYGLLGKNGTGKSTLLYLMMGLLRPEQGEVRIDGISAQQRQPEVLRDMFLVPEEYDLPHIQLSEYVRSLKPFYPRFDEQLLSECLEGFDMPKDVNLGALSMGQKKKVYICIALAAGTRYLLMDEPTNGLDILSKSQFRKVVIKGMTDDKIILISTHQVHDVERLLDHVIIVDNNRVLMHQPLVEKDEPVNMEELFVNALQGNVPAPAAVADEASAEDKAPMQAPAEEKSADEENRELPASGHKASLWNVARWDMTVNKPFYLRSLLTILGVICLPVLFSYLAIMTGNLLTLDVGFLCGFINFFSLVMSIVGMGYILHNLLTKQGRINELTLPATNLKKFCWHFLVVWLGVELAELAGVLLADLIHLILGTAVLQSGSWESLTAHIYSYEDSDFLVSMSGVEHHPQRFLCFVLLMGCCFYSTFALGNAWKYKYNIPLTIACHIGFMLCSMVAMGFTASFFAHHMELTDKLFGWIAFNPDVVSVLFVLFACLLLAGIWWLTYHLYCRAQLTTKANP